MSLRSGRQGGWEAGFRACWCRLEYLRYTWIALLAFFASSVSAPAQGTNGPRIGNVSLHPPHPEIPPGIWEQHWPWIIGAVVLMALIATAAVHWLRKEPLPVVEPIESRTRRELVMLVNHAPSAQTLSNVTRCLRVYLSGAFGLPPEELTTSELHQAIESNGMLEAELKSRLIQWFSEADQLKFAPARNIAPERLRQAQVLFEQCEQRRAALQQAATKPPVNR